jgi:sentrin-specific protease 1
MILIFRWTKDFNIFDMDKLFFPINLANTHWALAVCFMSLKEIWYCDSLTIPTRSRYLHALLQYLSDESKMKLGVALNVEEWKLINCSAEDIPQQENGYDCGAFTVMYADLITDGIPLSFLNQSMMPDFRIKICNAIVQGTLPYDM